MRCIFMAVVLACCAAGATAASNTSAESDPSKPPVLDAGEKCTDAVVQTALPIWPKDALRSGTVGWVVVRYDLDGSGRAQNAEISASAPQQVFDKASVDSVKRSKFATGFAKTGCKTVLVYSLQANS
ncbi:hypothetical protein GCM10027277_36230 [Pseudoduganella ginsengisoli]|uniref:TonB family protein n=1 Tax=Pseudoduganella ginsengisoli TaxID=1462440 RepID=A0A6L6PXP9_9BURK|nr:TonB family protein [Pseudoduganella ginsengisoli]MTW02245.1 TonB family protein [Pseudoduganella ginsengisoli]